MVAVSGGADSVALLRALMRLSEPAATGPPRLIAAHYNHRWRGADSDADEAFVRELCSSLGVPCHVGRAEANQPANLGDGLEAAARQARYDFLTQAARQSGARYVAVAHTADDQVETVLHRIVRGTGLAGLAGMLRLRPLCDGATLVRPLLDVRREEVLAYLESLGQLYRSDETNLDPAFTRVRIRRELLPLLRESYNVHVDEALLRLARLAGESQGVIDELIERLAQRVVRPEGNAVRIDCEAIRGLSRCVVRELLISVWKARSWPQQEMSFEKWDELASMALEANPAPAKRDFPGGVSGRRLAAGLILSLVPGDGAQRAP
jgi:tRNA(Ile)-lysidine synthase